MSRQDDRVSMQQGRAQAQEAIAMGGGKTREEIVTDRKLRLALSRLIEIVGEAASTVSQEARHNHPESPWPGMISMRNRRIHGYDTVDLAVLRSRLSVDLRQFVARRDVILGH
jgi:uncharacterized protein with HEPN domain